MIDKLTPEQEALIPVVRDEWIGKLKAGRKIDQAKCIEGIKWLYSFCKFKEPQIMFVKSPLAAQIYLNYLESFGNLQNQVGDQVWAQVGAQVRAQVWAQVWAQVRNQVGAQVWAQVWAQVRNQVGAQVWAQVGDQVWAQVRDQVRDQVWAQVRNQVRNQVWDQVGAQVWAQVWAQVGDQVRDQVGDQVRANNNKYFSFSSYGNVSDCGWLAFYSYFEHIGIDLKNDSFHKFCDLIESGIYDMIQLDGLCVVCEMPSMLNRDSRGRLHATKGPAIAWDDSYEIYALWGVRLDKDLFKKITDRKISAKEIIQLKNIEQRMVALKYLGAEHWLNDLDAKLLDKSERGNELYQIDKIFPNTQYCLKYSCPSTGRVYVSFVDPKSAQDKKADHAMAWKLNLTPEEYNLLETET